MTSNYMKFFLDIYPKMTKQYYLVTINQIIISLLLIDKNNDSGLIGFWNDLKLYIEKL